MHFNNMAVKVEERYADLMIPISDSMIGDELIYGADYR